MVVPVAQIREPAESVGRMVGTVELPRVASTVLAAVAQQECSSVERSSRLPQGAVVLLAQHLLEERAVFLTANKAQADLLTIQVGTRREEAAVRKPPLASEGTTKAPPAAQQDRPERHRWTYHRRREEAAAQTLSLAMVEGAVARD